MRSFGGIFLGVTGLVMGVGSVLFWLEGMKVLSPGSAIPLSLLIPVIAGVGTFLIMRFSELRLHQS